MGRARRTPRWRVDRLPHPALPLLVAVDDDDALVYVALAARAAGLLQHAARHGARTVVETRRRTRARRQIGEYLAGRRTTFDLRLRPLGSAFEVAVWQALQDVAYGSTCSYGALAGALATGGSARAVGRANGSNPLPIVIPCHRVIGATGELVGFGGGLPVKRWLLQLEQHRLPPAWRPGEPEPTQLGLFA